METMAKKRPKPNPWKKKLKALRAKLGITQREAARKMGVPLRTWISWENAQNHPSLTAVQLLKVIFPDLD